MSKREKAASLIDSLLDALDTPEQEEPTPQQIQDAQFEPKELIVDQRSGKVRQAGADLPEGQFIDDFRRRSEESLFVFAKGVLSRDRLTTTLHKPVCQWFTDSPPYRKLLLLPRDHYKCIRKVYWNKVRKRIAFGLNPAGLAKSENHKIEDIGAIAPIFRVVTSSGREIEVTPNHPFMRWGGVWQSLKEGLSVGDWVGIVRRSVFGKYHNPNLALIVGWMLADASLPNQTITITKPKHQKIFLETVAKLKGIDASVSKSNKIIIGIRKMRPIWRDWDLLEARAREKFVPSVILNGDEETIRAFLRGILYFGDGSLLSGKTRGGVTFVSTSKQLTLDVQHLVTKFGIHSAKFDLKNEFGPFYHLNFTDTEGLMAKKPQRLEKDSVSDRFPPRWRSELRKGEPYRVRKCGIRIDNKYATTRKKVARVALLLGKEKLQSLCASDIGWETIKSIESLGEHEIVSIESPSHTLTVGDIVTHNTTIASQCLPIHILIQPKERNHYMPGKWGPDCRILLVCESEARAANHLRWIESRFESCAILRALWPQCCWENPRRESKKWNEQALLLPRKQDYSDPTIQIKGVGGVVTGAHVDVMIKDDLISIEAANSAIVMQTAIQWHVASRALMDDPDKSLEYIIGTRWAVHDLYSYIMDEDPTVDVKIRAIVENGKPILPELFKLETITRLKKEFGVLFPLLYMNSASDPSLVDFDITEVREHTIEDGYLEFESDDRDIVLQERDKEPGVDPDILRGQPLNAETLAALSPRDSYLRLKAQ